MSAMNAMDAVRLLRSWGVTVEQVKGKGEMRVDLPSGRPVLFQHPTRRKDASRALLIAVKRWSVERGVSL